MPYSKRCRKPQLDSLARLFQVAEDSLLSFPELDHYPARGPARYWGMLPAAVAEDSTWPAAPGPRVFSYLRPETPHVEALCRRCTASRQHPDLRARPAGGTGAALRRRTLPSRRCRWT
jgi:hypothetical protein